MAELTRRYLIQPIPTEVPMDLMDPDGAFVLKPWKDPAALRALGTYRDNCYPELATELDAWVRAIKAGPVIRGGVGRRNEPHLKKAAAPAVTKPAARPKPKPMRRAPKAKPAPKARPKPRAKARPRKAAKAGRKARRGGRRR